MMLPKHTEVAPKVRRGDFRVLLFLYIFRKKYPTKHVESKVGCLT